MVRTLKILPLIAAVGLLAACESGSDLQRAGMGAAAGAVVAGATDNDLATGALVGAAAGALSDDAARVTGTSF
ncbi:hypothetical protein [Tropicimonas sp.]|uniref:hypothetical protein n=1 Tax=Tropicimonas sp. TaxID=2067044 RepID=UPI003A87ED1C